MSSPPAQVRDPNAIPKSKGKEVADATESGKQHKTKGEVEIRNRRRSHYCVGDNDEDEDENEEGGSSFRKPRKAGKIDEIVLCEEDDVKVNVRSPSNSEKDEMEAKRGKTLEVEKLNIKGKRSMWASIWKKKDKKQKPIKSNNKETDEVEKKAEEKKDDGKTKITTGNVKQKKVTTAGAGEGEEETSEPDEKPPKPVDNRAVVLAAFLTTFTTATHFLIPGVLTIDTSSSSSQNDPKGVSIGSGFVTGWEVLNMLSLINSMCVLFIQATLIAPFHTPMTEKIAKAMGGFILWIATIFMVSGFIVILHGISLTEKETLSRHLTTFAIYYVSFIVGIMIVMKLWAFFWCVKDFLNKCKEKKEKKKEEVLE